MKAVLRTITKSKPDDPVPRTCAEVVVSNGKAIVNGEEWVRTLLENEDIGCDYSLDDGDLFVKSLSKALRSPYLLAELVD